MPKHVKVNKSKMSARGAKLPRRQSLSVAFGRLLHIKLTQRELDCCKWLVIGYSAGRIAEKLGISTRTVEHYINNLKIKLCCADKHSLSEYLRMKLNISVNDIIDQATVSDIN